MCAGLRILNTGSKSHVGHSKRWILRAMSGAPKNILMDQQLRRTDKNSVRTLGTDLEAEIYKSAGKALYFITSCLRIAS